MKKIVCLIAVVIASISYASEYPSQGIQDASQTYKISAAKADIVDKYETYKNYVSYLNDKVTVDERFIDFDKEEQFIFILREIERLNEQCYSFYKTFAKNAIQIGQEGELDTKSLTYANQYFELCKLLVKKHFDFIDQNIKNLSDLDQKQALIYKEKMKKIYIKRGLFLQKKD